MKINDNENSEKIELWGDVVSIKHLIFSIFICCMSTAILYAIKHTLFFGLLGSVIGFIISSLIIKPKRNIL